MSTQCPFRIHISFLRWFALGFTATGLISLRLPQASAQQSTTNSSPALSNVRLFCVGKKHSRCFEFFKAFNNNQTKTSDSNFTRPVFLRQTVHGTVVTQVPLSVSQLKIAQEALSAYLLKHRQIAAETNLKTKTKLKSSDSINAMIKPKSHSLCRSIIQIQLENHGSNIICLDQQTNEDRAQLEQLLLTLSQLSSSTAAPDGPHASN